MHPLSDYWLGLCNCSSCPCPPAVLHTINNSTYQQIQRQDSKKQYTATGPRTGGFKEATDPGAGCCRNCTAEPHEGVGHQLCHEVECSEQPGKSLKARLIARTTCRVVDAAVSCLQTREYFFLSNYDPFKCSDRPLVHGAADRRGCIVYSCDWQACAVSEKL
jgi:hypothetical protein